MSKIIDIDQGAPATVLGVGVTTGIGVTVDAVSPRPAGCMGPIPVSVHDSSNTTTIPVPPIGAGEKGK